MIDLKTGPAPNSIAETLSRNLIFVGGKGGVGKTVVSQALALLHAQSGKKTLWVAIEDPTRPPGELKKTGPSLWHLNCEATHAFEEYAGLKIGISALTQLFLKNKLMRYLAQAAPGIHELVLLGKIWHERLQYDHVVVDMPSTGYGLAMFQSTENFSRLFRGGPIHRDAEAMLATFADPKQVGQVIIAIPEEMPLQEALELDDYLAKLFPKNRAAFIANKIFPHSSSIREPANDWEKNPLARTAKEYIERRQRLEADNLKTWEERSIPWKELEMVPPNEGAGLEFVVRALAEQLQSRIVDRALK